ncbi:MAG TPA: IPT/TIG domain-containing protein, partial [Candidatus Methylomirabilis sp.]
MSATSLVLSGPSGRVEGSVATAESGLLAFFTPRAPLAPDTTYTLALAGLADTADHPLPAFTSTFTTVKGSGEPPTIASFTPTAGAEGDPVTLTGTNFVKVSGVRFGGIAAASFSAVSATQIAAVVPPGALTGPLSVSTPAGTAQSQGSFVVLQRPDFKLAAAPNQAETVQGDSVAFAVNVLPAGGFTGMVRLAVSGLPAQLTATLDKPQLGPVGYAYVTLQADPRLQPGQYRFTVTGTASLGGKEVQR